MERYAPIEQLDDSDLRIMELYGKLLAELYRRGLIRGSTADDLIARYRLKDVSDRSAVEDI